MMTSTVKWSVVPVKKNVKCKDYKRTQQMQQQNTVSYYYRNLPGGMLYGIP